MRRVFAAPRVNGGLPEWLASAAVHEWVELPSPSTSPAPSPAAAGSRSAVVNAWGGGAIRPSGSHYLLSGGGHGDYAGNEIYLLKLSDADPAWERAWGPTPNADITESTTHYADGNPATAHTYNQLHYDDANDRLFRVLGGYWVGDGTPATVDAWPWASRGAYGDAGSAGGWVADGTFPDVPSLGVLSGAFIVRIPATGEFCLWGNWYKYRWTPGDASWTHAGSDDVNAGYSACVYDPDNHCVWGFGGYSSSSGTVAKWDLTTNSASRPSVSGTGTAICTTNTMGATWDSDASCAWIYDGSGSVFKFTPSDMQIDTISMSGTGPGSNSSYGNSAGTWNRIQYAPELQGVVITPAWSAPTFFFRSGP